MNKKLNILLGCFIISYIFYIRFLTVRLPKDLYFISESKIQYSHKKTNIIWLILCLYILMTSIKVLLGKNNTEGFLSKILTKVKDIIYKALYEVYIFPRKYMENAYDQLSDFCAKFYKLFGNKREDIFLIISYICRTIVVIVFLHDIFFAFRLDYFYKTLILLFIPISINILFFIFYDFSTKIYLNTKR